MGLCGRCSSAALTSACIRRLWTIQSQRAARRESSNQAADRPPWSMVYVFPERSSLSAHGGTKSVSKLAATFPSGPQRQVDLSQSTNSTTVDSPTTTTVSLYDRISSRSARSTDVLVPAVEHSRGAGIPVCWSAVEGRNMEHRLRRLDRRRTLGPQFSLPRLATLQFLIDRLQKFLLVETP